MICNDGNQGLAAEVAPHYQRIDLVGQRRELDLRGKHARRIEVAAQGLFDIVAGQRIEGGRDAQGMLHQGSGGRFGSSGLLRDEIDERADRRDRGGA